MSFAPCLLICCFFLSTPFIGSNSITKSWILRLIGKSHPASIYTSMDPNGRLVNNSNPDPSCLIDSPQITMANKYLDVNVDQLITNVFKTAALTPGERSKPLLATVRGVGGGKTRCLEEVRRDLLLKDGCLPIGITFNLRTCGTKDVNFWCYDRESELAAALSIVVRMLYAVFGTTDSFDYWIKKVTQSLPFLDDCDEVKGVELIRNTAHVIVDIITQYRPIDTLVVLIDESLVLDTELRRNYPVSLGGCTDPLWVVRSAFLDSKLHPNVDTALMMASLGLSPIGRTSSNRLVTPVVLPARLNPKKVVDTWLCLADLSPKETNLLLFLVATMNNLPRTLQYLKTFCDQWRRCDVLGPDWIHGAYDNSIESLKHLYEPLFPSTRLFHHIIFQDDICIDDEVANAIEDSIITNSLDQFKKGSTLVPQSSPLMLIAAKASTNRSPAQAVLRALIEGILAPTSTVGDVLKQLFLGCLQVRAIATVASRHKDSISISVGKFLGLADVSDLRDRDLNILKVPLVMKRTPVIHMMKSSSRKETQVNDFIYELGDVKVSYEEPLVLIVAAVGDAFDIAAKVRKY